MDFKRDYLKYILHGAILIGLIWAAVKYVNGAEVLKALQNFELTYLPFLFALSLAYFLLKAGRFTILMSPFSGAIAHRVVYKGYIAGQPATLLPGGIAARAGLMKQAGVPVSESSVPIAVHSGLDQTVFLLSALVAALWFPEARTPVMIVLAMVAVAAAVLLFPPARRKLRDIAERIARRFDYEEQWQHFLDAIPQVLTPKIIGSSLLITVITLGIYIVMLDLTLRGLALSAGYPTLFLAIVLPTMMGRLVPVPGGIGVTEASMVGFLTSLGGFNTDTTVAAVAIFRITAIVFPAALGALIYFLFWNEEEGGSSEKKQQASMEVSHASTSDL